MNWISPQVDTFEYVLDGVTVSAFRFMQDYCDQSYASMYDFIHHQISTAISKYDEKPREINWRLANRSFYSLEIELGPRTINSITSLNSNNSPQKTLDNIIDNYIQSFVDHLYQQDNNFPKMPEVIRRAMITQNTHLLDALGNIMRYKDTHQIFFNDILTDQEESWCIGLYER